MSPKRTSEIELHQRPTRLPGWERTLRVWAVAASICFASGCSLIPDIKHKPQYLNPFPQIRTVAVLPFVNQSEEPTLSSERVTLAYINELQAIPGFEVLPLGVVRAKLEEYNQPLASGEDFQEFARNLGVDAVLLGSVTDFQSYYPPRMSMKVNWYAANPGFHPVLPGYGLPWGTKAEKKIPRWIHQEAQRALASEQLRSQTPEMASQSAPPASPTDSVTPAQPAVPLPEDQNELEGQMVKPISLVSNAGLSDLGDIRLQELEGTDSQSLPADWPDPKGFVPNGPSASRPVMLAQYDPIISHMRSYDGHDEDFTRRLSDYFYFRDDVRFGGWQSYLQRSEDFIRVCCYFHITETLACRGGEDESRLILRWPIDRYQR